jgi:hypothetical protein
MKKNLFPFCALPFLLFAFAVNAQHKRLYKSFFFKDLKNSPSGQTNHSFFKTDAVAHWRRISTYNVTPDGNDTLTFAKYTYLSNDSLSKTLIRSRQSNKTFADTALISYSYDAAGPRTVTLTQAFDGGHNLINISRDSSAYDTHGNLIYQDQESWMGGSWKIQNGNKSIFTYDSKGNITQEISQITDTTGTFLNDSKTLLYWNAGGTVIDSGFGYYYDTTNTWVLSARAIDIVFYKNNINKPISALIQVDTIGKWEDAERLTATYNSLGNMLTSLDEQYKKGSWVPVERQSAKYTSHNDRYFYILEFYIDSTKNFIGFDGTADSLIYDTNGNLTSDQVSYLIMDTTWIQGIKQLHQYKDMSGIEIASDSRAGYIIFPNPCNNQFFIKNMNPSESLKISVYDISGRIVLENQYAGDAQISVNTTALAKGIYNIMINNGKLVALVRLVKN